MHERDRLRREAREDALEDRLDDRRRIVLQHEERVEDLGWRQLLEILDAAQLPELDVARMTPDVLLREREERLDMEMHMLPQKDVFRLIAQNHMELFEVLNQTNELMMVADCILLRKS
jgi:hypothetical protein